MPLSFLDFVQTQFNNRIKVVQSEFGGQLRHFTKYLTNLGIVHRLTCPQTSHQNGIIEQKHK